MLFRSFFFDCCKIPLLLRFKKTKDSWVLLPFLLLLRIDLLGVSDFLRLGIDGGWFWVNDGSAFAPVRFPVEGF